MTANIVELRGDPGQPGRAARQHLAPHAGQRTQRLHGGRSVASVRAGQGLQLIAQRVVDGVGLSLLVFTISGNLDQILARLNRISFCRFRLDRFGFDRCLLCWLLAGSWLAGMAWLKPCLLGFL